MNLSMVPQTLAIVVPCYNEQEVFPISLTILEGIIEKLITNNKISKNSYILFVDDGSKDNTWALINETSKQNQYVKGIKLSRNKGHQIALIAGLTNATADMVVTIDADLQDDPNIIEAMVDQHLEGMDIVYGVRSSRVKDSFFKRTCAESFYKLMELLGVEQVYNHADFRLLSRRALNALLQYQEENLYLRGLVPMVGFKATKVFYERAERAAGFTKYPFRKSLGLAIEGITSLSVKPLRIITLIGILVFLFSILSAIYAIVEKLLGNTIQGWTSVIIIITFFGGLQILTLGIIGEYVGKIYNEVKKRPKFFIDDKCGNFASDKK